MQFSFFNVSKNLGKVNTEYEYFAFKVANKPQMSMGPHFYIILQ